MMRPLSNPRLATRRLGYGLQSFPAFVVFLVLIGGGAETIVQKICGLLLIAVLQGLNGWVNYYYYDIWFDTGKNLFVIKRFGLTNYIDGNAVFKIKDCGFLSTRSYLFYAMVINGRKYRFKAYPFKTKLMLPIMSSDAEDLESLMRMSIGRWQNG